MGWARGVEEAVGGVHGLLWVEGVGRLASRRYTPFDRLRVSGQLRCGKLGIRVGAYAGGGFPPAREWRMGFGGKGGTGFRLSPE